MKYAGVYARKDSPYWWIWFWNPIRQRRDYEATPFLRTAHNSKSRARDLAVEKSQAAVDDKLNGGVDRWERWVEPWLRLKYSGPDRAKTLTRITAAWKQWREFLALKKIAVPRALSYQNVVEFVQWRSSQVKSVSKKKVSKNTALIDTKFMSVILREAQRRGFVNGVVTLNLDIRKDKPAEKPEILPEELAKIREELKTRPEWMRICFEIAIHQGCRLSETQVSFERIDFVRDTIQFVAKGRNGQPHVFTTTLHPGLRPLLLELKARGLCQTCELPRMAAKEWHFFFKEIGLPHLKFHSTRVTVVTNLARNDINQQQAMNFVGHASDTIHAIYTRLKPRDTGRAVAALAALSSVQSPSAQPAAVDLAGVSTEQILAILTQRLAASSGGAKPQSPDAVPATT